MDRLSALKNQLLPNETSQTQSYRYTVDGGCLTQAQRDFYEENGYLVIPGLFKKEKMDAWKARFLEYCNGRKTPMGMVVVRDISLVKSRKAMTGEAAVTKIQDWQDDEVLMTYCTDEALVPYLKSFCGQDVKSVHTMLLNKPPYMGKSSRHPLHQDLAYFPFRPEDRIVGVWSALEDVTRENGGLVVYPKSHKLPFLDHGMPEWEHNRAYWGIKKIPKLEEPLYPQMKAGDAIFFHPHVVHGSGENKTTGFRKSICVHFASAHCKYIDIKGTFHEELAKDIMDYAKKKFGDMAPSYQDIWRFKSRIVVGNADPDGL